MSIFNLGSINIDYIYTLPRLLAAGETLASTSFSAALGGKGANQSIALARAGADVRHAGQLHEADTAWLGGLREAGVDCSHILQIYPPAMRLLLLMSRQQKTRSS